MPVGNSTWPTPLAVGFSLSGSHCTMWDCRNESLLSFWMEIRLYTSETLDHSESFLWLSHDLSWYLICTATYHVHSSDVCCCSGEKAKPQRKKIQKVQWNSSAIAHLANEAKENDQLSQWGKPRADGQRDLIGHHAEQFYRASSYSLHSTTLEHRLLILFNRW